MTPELGFLSPRRTKLRPPRLAGDVIVRPRLLARLNSSRIALVVAPAGYGKTTVVSTWLAQAGVPYAWISLNKEDNDPRMFLAGVVAAIANLFAGFGSTLLEILAAPHARAFAELSTLLLNALDALSSEFTLVLDDYHVINEPEIHQLLIALATHLPHSLRLVLTARYDPPLPWHIRTRSGVCELRAADLSFTEAEVAEFLYKACGQPVAEGDVRILFEGSQGWITGLRLAALHVRQHPADGVLPDLLARSRRSLVDYFRSELLGQLAPEVFTFLTRTAILDLLTGPLCDCVVDDAAPQDLLPAPLPSRGAALLRQLEAAGAFVLGLDEEGAWYRYHPLFKQVLQQQLRERASSAEIVELYLRACRWHEDQGLLDEALGYALASGTTAPAVDFVRRHRHRLLDNMELQRLERWLRQFPPGAVDAHVDLLLTRAWIHQFRYSLPAVNLDVAHAAALAAAMPPDAEGVAALWGEIAALRSQQHLADGDADATIAAAQRGLAATPPHSFYIRSYTLLYLALGCQMAGDLRRAHAVLAPAAEEPGLPPQLVLLRTIQLRSFVNLVAARLGEVDATVPTMLRIASARALRTSMAWAHYFLGCAAYLQNALGRAVEQFAAVTALADYAHTRAYTHSTIGLALAHQALGAPQAAGDAVRAAGELLARTQAHEALPLLDAFAAELAARQGRVEEALRWADRTHRSPAADATPMFYTPELAAVRIYLWASGRQQLDEAHARLARHKAAALRTHNVHSQIQAAALEAALYQAQGCAAEAATALAQALALAAGSGAVRVFVDLAAELAPVCAALAAQAPPAGFAAEVHAAVMHEVARQSAAAGRGQAAAGNEPAGGTAAAPAPAVGDLRTLLTYREMDVLRLLCQRLTNKEIARELGISTETVRQHTVNLFRKLQVGNRRQAVVAARSLGYVDGA